MKLSKSWVIGLIVVSAIIGLGYWAYRDSSKSKVSEKIADMGREHVTDIYGIKYNSNPPTSGPHFPVWAKPGFYERLISDGYLIHSMEHGYVIIWYDCGKISTNAFSLITPVFAHDEPAKESTDSGEKLMHMNVAAEGDMSWFTPENPPEVEVELPESFKAASCRNLVEELKPFLNLRQRVIITPRIDLDTKIVLTAWTRMLKLDSVDKEKIEDFIRTYHNKGPEQTME